MSHHDAPSTADLIASTTESLSALLRAEVALVRATLKVGLTRLITVFALAGCAALAGFLGLILLAMSSVDALVELGLSPVLAGLAVGGGLLALAFIFGLAALVVFKRMRVGFARAATNIGRDAQTIKAALHDT